MKYSLFKLSHKHTRCVICMKMTLKIKPTSCLWSKHWDLRSELNSTKNQKNKSNQIKLSESHSVEFLYLKVQCVRCYQQSKAYLIEGLRSNNNNYLMRCTFKVHFWGTTLYQCYATNYSSTPQTLRGKYCTSYSTSSIWQV